MQLVPLQGKYEDPIQNSLVPVELVMRIKEDLQKAGNLGAVEEKYGVNLVKQALGIVKNGDGTEVPDKKENAYFKVGDYVEIVYAPERGQTGVIKKIEGNKYYLAENPGDTPGGAWYYAKDLKKA